MENRKLIDRDEIYFLVFFSNFFIGMLLLTIKYNFDSIQAFFVFANIDPIPFFFLFIVFIACLYYFIKLSNSFLPIFMPHTASLSALS